jgi:hypothetical protein
MVSPAPATPDELLLRCHFVYEVEMLWGTYQRFIENYPRDQVIRNALIESFCLHARNLIEFLQTKHRKYAHRSYQPFAAVPKNKIDTITDRLNNQISHLRLGRTIERSEKIDIKEREEILQLLSGEISQFKANLTSGYKNVDAPDLPPVPLRETLFPAGTITTTSSPSVTVVSTFSPEQK